MTRKVIITAIVPLLAVQMIGAAAGCLLIFGCSDNDPTISDTSELAVTLPAFDELIASVTPPIFDGPATTPTPASPAEPDTSIGYWTQGSGALLSHAFGNDQPMALHRNMHQLGETVQWMNRVRNLGDTTFTEVPGDTGTLSGTISVTRMQTIGIPEACQAALGDLNLRLQYRVSVRFNEQTQTQLEAGFRQDDTCDALLAYNGSAAPDSVHPNAFEHSLMYAYRDRVKDSFQLRAVHVRAYNDGSGQCAMWTYEVAGRSQNQFQYRMTWYADDFSDSAGIGCFIGSGHRQTQFALRYQQMIPADRSEPDPNDPHGHLHRIFGPNYADQGSTLTSGWNDATDPAKMFRYEHLPVALKFAPSEMQASLNPWYGQ